jgi:hypothetical protein
VHRRSSRFFLCCLIAAPNIGVNKVRGGSQVLYLVQTHAEMKTANAIDAGHGPGPFFSNVVERFWPEAIYGSPDRRSLIMVVNLDTPAQMAELMYALTWFSGTEPTFTPIMKPEVYGEAIANAKRIINPPVA